MLTHFTSLCMLMMVAFKNLVAAQGVNCVKFNVHSISNMSIASNMPSCMHIVYQARPISLAHWKLCREKRERPSWMHNLPSLMHNFPSWMHNLPS